MYDEEIFRDSFFTKYIVAYAFPCSPYCLRLCFCTDWNCIPRREKDEFIKKNQLIGRLPRIRRSLLRSDAPASSYQLPSNEIVALCASLRNIYLRVRGKENGEKPRVLFPGFRSFWKVPRANEADASDRLLRDRNPIFLHVPLLRFICPFSNLKCIHDVAPVTNIASIALS